MLGRARKRRKERVRKKKALFYLLGELTYHLSVRTGKGRKTDK
jgi:hypothetical protein